MKRPLIVIVGPTAVGKSRLALELARRLDGEIVGADSRHVYRRMDIGSGKPTAEERRVVPHHLVDVVDIDESFTVADYQRLAYQAIDNILERGRLPFLVGGSGLHVAAVVCGLRPPQVPPNPALRAQLEAVAASEGTDALVRELEALDPEAVRTIDRRNPRRLIRAIEVSRLAGQPFSRLRRREPPPYDILQIGLTLDRAELYRRVDARVDNMMASGLVEEVESLVAAGYSFDLPAMSGIGYREVGAYLRGEVELVMALRRVKSATHRYARRQYAWFHLDDPDIHWFQTEPWPGEAVARAVEAWVE